MGFMCCIVVCRSEGRDVMNHFTSVCVFLKRDFLNEPIEFSFDHHHHHHFILSCFVFYIYWVEFSFVLHFPPPGPLFGYHRNFYLLPVLWRPSGTNVSFHISKETDTCRELKR